MESNDFLAHKLKSLSFISYSSEQGSNYLAEHLPVVFQASEILTANVTKTFTLGLGKSLPNEFLKSLRTELKACALLGICIFDTRFHFAKQLHDSEAQKIDLRDLEYTKIREPLAEEIVKVVIDAMENGKKVDVLENTPAYVMMTLSNVTTEIMARFIETNVIEKLTEKEIEIFYSGLYYLIANVYFCGIIYAYLATKPENNSLQDLIKKTFKIK